MRIYESDVLLTLDRVRSLPTSPIPSDWHGAPLTAPIQWFLGRDPVALWFRAVVPQLPVFDNALRPGQFVEGLWEQDVAELFIGGEAGHYQEFNLNPAGAWWTCFFTGYRTRAIATRRPETICIDTDITPSSWDAVLAVRSAELSVPLTQRSTVHVSFILHGQGKQYVSSHPVGGREPDYHLPECFRPVQLTSASVGA
jgi:hypothetical protein